MDYREFLNILNNVLVKTIDKDEESDDIVFVDRLHDLIDITKIIVIEEENKES